MIEGRSRGDSDKTKPAELPVYRVIALDIATADLNYSEVIFESPQAIQLSWRCRAVGAHFMPPLQTLVEKGFQVDAQSHAWAILTVDFPEALKELENALLSLTIPIEEIVGSGGGETKGTQRLRKSLFDHGWRKVNFRIEKTINGVPRESISHEVDHVRVFPDNKLVALEIEWNNKDPFFDRDLENFKRLHAEGAISVGIVVTRGVSLQSNMKHLVGRFAGEQKLSSFDDLEKIGLSPTKRQKSEIEKRMKRKKGAMNFLDAWTDHFVSDKFGTATTHWEKLEDRVHRGVGNPCPLVLIGLPDTIVTFHEAAAYLEELAEAEAAIEPELQAQS